MKLFSVNSTALRIISIAAAILAIGCSLWFSKGFLSTPKVVNASPAENEIAHDTQTAIRLNLDNPINSQKVKLSITPEVAGSWRFEDNSLVKNFFKVIIFQPDRAFQPDTNYTVRAENLTGMLGNEASTYTYTFHTKGLPTISSSSIEDKDTDVGICNLPTFTLDQPAQNRAVFEFGIEPSSYFTTEETDTKITLKPKGCLQQNTDYTLTAYRQLILYSETTQQITYSEEPETHYVVHFRTKAAPGIEEVSPQGSTIFVDTKQIRIRFSQNMKMGDPSDYISLSPVLEGKWQWENATNLVFESSTPLAHGTKYTLAIKEGLSDEREGYLPEDAIYTFTTIGNARVSGMYPTNGASGLNASSTLSVTFDQEVDKASAESHFSLTPATTGTMSWKGNTLYYKTTLQKDTRYTLLMGAGVKSVHGLESKTEAKSSFQTEESQTLLTIANDYQDKPLSCEAASLKMALNYRGLNVNEDDIMQHVGFDSTPHQDGTWGDPDQAFVGSITGKQNTTGYGVHWGPIARAGNHWRQTQAFTGWSVNQIAEQIAAGNPVIAWGTAGNATRDSWQTPAGRTIYTWVGEHVRLVVGFTGKADNPTGFIINDPTYGRLRWTASQLSANLATLGYSGVVVY